MSKKKAIVCTMLFGIIIFVALAVLLIVQEETGRDVYQTATSCVTGWWLYNRMDDFYEWLLKTE